MLLLYLLKSEGTPDSMLLSAIRRIELKRLGLVECICEMRTACNMWEGNQKGKIHIERRRQRRKNIIKLAQLWAGPVMVSCEHGKKPFRSIKCRTFLTS
jgi:hypothetical protein